MSRTYRKLPLCLQEDKHEPPNYVHPVNTGKHERAAVKAKRGGDRKSGWNRSLLSNGGTDEAWTPQRPEVRQARSLSGRSP